LLLPVASSLPAAIEAVASAWPVSQGRTRFSEVSGVRNIFRSSGVGSRRAASAATMRSMRPFSDHQMPRPMAMTSRTVNGAGV